MRRLILLTLGLTVLSGCAWFRDPPQAGITTGATVVYNGGPGGEVFSLCDRGNLVYLTKSQPQVAVLKDGCNPQVAEANLAQATAVRALAERAERTPPFTLPQPFVVQVVPAPGAPMVEPQTVVVQIQPQDAPPTLVCPACPVAAPALQPQVLPRSVAKAAPKAVVVSQVDPNTASLADLERLPGVTKQAAEAITRGRPYRTVHDLVAKKVLTEAELRALAPYFVIR